YGPMAKQRSTQSTPSSQRRGFDGIFLQINPGHENTKTRNQSLVLLRAFVISWLHLNLKPSAVLCALRVIRQELPTSRFSNRVNSRMNASLTTPVGPLRCLPTISSAMPCASVGGWLRSTY